MDYRNQGMAINQGLNVASQSYADPAPAAPHTVLENILSRVNTAIAHASINADKASNFASKLLGEQPQNTSKEGTRPCRSGMLGEIQDRLDVLSEILAVCDAQLNRVNDAV